MANFNWSLSTIWFLYQEKRSQRARRGAFGSLRIYIGISTNTAKWAKSTKIHANAVHNHKRRIFTDLFGSKRSKSLPKIHISSIFGRCRTLVPFDKAQLQDFCFIPKKKMAVGPKRNLSTFWINQEWGRHTLLLILGHFCSNRLNLFFFNNADPPQHHVLLFSKSFEGSLLL